MADTFLGEVIPLWRIHNLGTCSGSTQNIVNIARPDTISLLRHLGGGTNPLLATGRLVLAADYKIDPKTLREATLVRIEKVFADPTGKETLNAELIVLCKCRIKDVNTADPFPHARRLPDLVPLWRIHNFDTIRNCLSEGDVNIESISRSDTVSLLSALGAGDVTRATGHLVMVCNYKDTLGAGMDAVLARIGKVSEGDPPLTCSLRMLGRVRCVEVTTTEGPFPQTLMDMVPLWRIHNLATSVRTEHKITNIGRPDSIGLLKHLGRGDPLAAVGCLVIGCDYKTLPSPRESATLMRITAVRGGGQGTYDAELMEVSSIVAGAVCVDESRADWWPRVSVELPRVWSKPASPSSVSPVLPRKPSSNPPAAVTRSTKTATEEVPKSLSIVRGVTAKNASDCPYWQRCFKVLVDKFLNTGYQFQDFHMQDADRCFCNDCHRLRGDSMVYKRAGSDYILPVGFARIGVKVLKSSVISKKGFESWHICYHGTKFDYVSDLLITGHLLSPGSSTYLGGKIAVREGHIQGSFSRRNDHTGTKETFDPTNKIFLSPTVRYCDYKGVYMSEHMVMGKHYRCALQVRFQPDTYCIGQETVNATEQIDPYIPNKSIEWYTTELHTHFFTGVLVAER
eukprot:Em0012g798a